MIVHVTTQGARVVREGRHLLVRKNNDTYHTLFPHRLRQLVLYGNVSLTPQALAVLLNAGVDTVFLRRDGRYKGRLEGLEPRNVFLRKRQFALTEDLEFRVHVSRAIVLGKLKNMATLLRRIQRGRRSARAGEAAEAIRRETENIHIASSLETLRGVEGAASRRYFQALREGFLDDQGFRKRVRRPPTDPVNSVLSLLYTFCINRMYAAVRLAGLDPAPGALHDLDYGRHALPLDLVEEFRPIVADALTLSMFNMGVLGREDFVEMRPAPTPQETFDAVEAASNDPLHGIELPQEDDEEGLFDMPEQNMPQNVAQEGDGARYPIRLRDNAFRRVIAAFEKKMDAEFQHPLAETRMTFGEAMVFQARFFRRVVEGEAAQYQPLLLR